MMSFKLSPQPVK